MYPFLKERIFSLPSASAISCVAGCAVAVRCAASETPASSRSLLCCQLCSSSSCRISTMDFLAFALPVRAAGTRSCR